MRKSFLLVTATALLITACDTKTEAPFGLLWSSSIDRFPAKGLLTFNRVALTKNEEMIYVTTVPKEDLGDGGYRFYFNEKKLKRIEFNTYDEINDVSGEKAKVTYERMKARLVERYGKPSEVSEHVYANSFRFIPCVTNENCGKWESIFIDETTIAKVSIQMGLTEDGYKKTSQSSRVMVEFTPR